MRWKMNWPYVVPKEKETVAADTADCGGSLEPLEWWENVGSGA
jgi:hypothetical protein